MKRGNLIFGAIGMLLGAGIGFLVGNHCTKIEKVIVKEATVVQRPIPAELAEKLDHLIRVAEDKGVIYYDDGEPMRVEVMGLSR